MWSPEPLLLSQPPLRPSGPPHPARCVRSVFAVEKAVTGARSFIITTPQRFWAHYSSLVRLRGNHQRCFGQMCALSIH